MKRSHWVILLSVATAAVVLVGANGLSPGPTRVAVCDVSKVMREYKRFLDAKGRIEADEKAAADETKARMTAVENMVKQLDELNKSSEDYRKLDAACWQKTYETRAFQEVQKNRLERDRVAVLLECYKDILAEVAAYAREAGIDLVHYTRDVQLDRAFAVQDVESIIGSNIVLYADAKLDVTAAVLERLNLKYTPKPDQKP